ncbi:MAG: glycosyltransferase [Planctomycetota bacterium]
MRTRIALLIESLFGGGAESFAVTLATALRAKGAEVSFFVLSPRCDFDAARGFDVHPVPDVKRRRGARMAQRVAALERAVAAAEERNGEKFGLFISNLDRVNEVVAHSRLDPAYLVIHNSIESELKREFRRGPFRYLRTVRSKRALNGRNLITVSNGIAEEIRSTGRIKPASLRTIYNPFLVDQIRTMADEPVPDLPEEPFVMHIGRNARQKRHDVLMKAFRRVPEPYKLVVLNNRERRTVRMARRYGLADRVIAPGFRQNPFAWLKRAELFVMSSDHEGFGRGLAESLLCGTPVVSTDCPHGPAEVLGESLRNWLVPTGRPDLLGDKINEALQTKIDLSGWTMESEIDAARIADQYLGLVRPPG